ncbi:dihydrofolate reductase family protein [Couchioplanes caeruleus]|uniref:dihydrofolate reductase family protein n=1 Tax=Couchioplanes caeruleus TaxID=56438 RepID=UPI0020BFF6E9|nr:dihydrofolate reductase family protein [Couchioplanes caeruleus]UQU62947.1 dihydrofolate reductase family protein [Couchioplanes caeruleus]
MTKVVADISVSLDGFVTGPGAGPEQGLGRGGEALHTWALAGDAVDRDVLTSATDATGVVVMGRRLFDVIDGPHGWSDEMGYGADLAAVPPVLVVTRTPPPRMRLAADRFTFVVDGIRSAVAKARAMAEDRDVVIMGGGETVRGAIDAGVVDELRLHLAPVLLGSGTPLFSGAVPRPLRQIHVQASGHATHLTYRVD